MAVVGVAEVPVVEEPAVVRLEGPVVAPASIGGFGLATRPVWDLAGAGPFEDRQVAVDEVAVVGDHGSNLRGLRASSADTARRSRPGTVIDS